MGKKVFGVDWSTETLQVSYGANWIDFLRCKNCSLILRPIRWISAAHAKRDAFT